MCRGAQGLSWFTAVRPAPSRWQHHLTVPSPDRSGLGLRLIDPSILPGSVISACHPLSIPPPSLSDMVVCSSFLIQPKAGKSWDRLGSHCT